MQLYSRENLEWREIEGFEEQYEVSNYGDFHIKPFTFYDKAGKKHTRREQYKWSEDLSEYGGDNDNGRYLGIHLGGMKKTYAHILAAKAFCPNPQNKPEVNHKNGDTKNNYCGCAENNYEDSNLEWVTRKENMKHASANGLINHESTLRKLQCKRNREFVDYDKLKRPIYQLDLNGIIIEQYPSISQAAEAMGVTIACIRSVALGESYHKSVKGYNWVFVDEYDSEKDYSVKIDQWSKAKRPVVQKNMHGEVVGEYESIREACRYNNFVGATYIGECCNGKRKHYKNYIWEYKKD